MVYRDWQSYQDALEAYNAVKRHHDSAIQQWEENVAKLTQRSTHTNRLNAISFSCIVIAGIISYHCNTLDSVIGWLAACMCLMAIHQKIDESCCAHEKQRLREEDPRRLFTLEKPTYEHSQDYAPPPKNESPPHSSAKMTFDSALAILGITKRSTLDEVKRAYRERMRQYHPDKVAHLGQELRDLAEHKAKETNEAYEYVASFFQTSSNG